MRFNGDTGTNYPFRMQTNGGSDSTYTTEYAYWYNGYGGTNDTDRFGVIDITNVFNVFSFFRKKENIPGREWPSPLRFPLCNNINFGSNEKIFFEKVGNFFEHQDKIAHRIE